MFILVGSRYLSFVSAEYVNPEIIIALSDLNPLSLKLTSNLGIWSSLASKPSKMGLICTLGAQERFANSLN